MPRFVVVSGLPASGKTTVGAAVAAALEVPLLDRDEILEGLFDALGVGDVAWRGRLSRAADVVLERLARRSRGAVIVSWWQHPQSQTITGTGTAWLHELTGEVIELHCICRAQVAIERFFARSRHIGHLDDSKSRDAELAKFDRFAALGALGIGRVVNLNTEEPIKIDEVVGQISRPLAPMDEART